MFEAGSC